MKEKMLEGKVAPAQAMEWEKPWPNFLQKKAQKLL